MEKSPPNGIKLAGDKSRSTLSSGATGPSMRTNFSWYFGEREMRQAKLHDITTKLAFLMKMCLPRQIKDIFLLIILVAKHTILTFERAFLKNSP